MINPEKQAELMISIVLPTYNEKGNIERLIVALQHHLKRPAEYIVVDDNSPDGTAQAVSQLMETVPGIRLIERTDARGLVSAIQRGINESRGEIIVWMDCDFSLPPEKVPELVNQIAEHGMDAAIGSRYVPGGNDETRGLSGPLIVLQKVCTNLLNKFTRFIMQTPFHDWTSGFIAIRADVVKQFPLQGDYGEYFILLMARLIRNKYSWIEIPYQNLPRTIGESKTAESFSGLFFRGIRYIVHVFKARRILTR